MSPTHDVASPLMPTNQEFTTWARDDPSSYNETLFHLYLNGAQRTKVSPSGARAVTSDSYMCQPRCHYGPIVSNFPTWRSDSKRSTEIKTPWTAALFGMLTRLFLQEVCPCSFILYVYLKAVVDDEDVLSRSPEQVKTPKPLGFFRKFFELQLLMVQHNAGLTASHSRQYPN
jgi:dolichyl-phosphate-mannose-protein mannosyltransferase